jgi:hypothetical protein
MGPLEGYTGAGLEMLLRGIREFFDCHDKPSFQYHVGFGSDAHV